MTRLTTRAAAGLMAGAMLFGASAAMADSSVAFTGVKATPSGDTLVVSGRAAFTAEPTEIASDSASDGMPGAELLGASIGFDGARDIEFTVELGGTPAMTAPAVASIEWDIDVNGKGLATTLTAINSSLSGLAVPTPGSYSFEYWDCTNDNLGCVVTDLAGRAEGSTVTFIVPRSTLGVSTGGGDQIHSPRIAVQPIVATPVATGKPGGADLDDMFGDSYTVPTTAVAMTVGGVTQTAPTTGSNGSFSASFTAPANSSVAISGLLDGVVVGTASL